MNTAEIIHGLAVNARAAAAKMRAFTTEKKNEALFAIADALEGQTKFEDVLALFDVVQSITHCSTGCGGCHDKVLDVISEIMMG